MNTHFRMRVVFVFSAISMASISHGVLLNGDFTEVGAHGSPYTSVGPSPGFDDESAAAHWFQFVPTPGGVLTSEIVAGFGPGGSNALHITTNTGSYDPASYGSGVMQAFGWQDTAIFSCDLFVASGIVYGGLVSAGGQYFDQTAHGATGQWIHIVQNVDSPTMTVSFENLEHQLSNADFYISNATMSSVPEPFTLTLGVAAIGLYVRRRVARRA